MMLVAFLCAFLCSAFAAHVEKTCDEKPDPGHCLAYVPQYYYDAESETCKRFIFGGCQGNGNRYDTEEECLKNCKAPQQADTDEICNLEAKSGPCRAAFVRYFFNKETGKCETFIYGGCRGNANNFQSKDECESSCAASGSQNVEEVCTLEPETGPCRALMPRYFYNAKTGKCEKFIYGGCGGNSNNFKSAAKCHSTCAAQGSQKAEELCTLEYETGPCRARIPRYYFNSKTGKCEKFFYGGCKGNANNFKNVEECHSTCAAQVGTQNSMICRLEQDAGPCKAFVTRYYFDSRTSTCREFIYGGCKGNENNFLTEADCRKACGRDTERPSNLVCSLEKDAGPCRAFVTRYYYDSRTRQCKEFVYGGCQGNENNFLSESDCLSACGKDTGRPPQSLICNLEKDPGPCDAYIQRYYYDHLMKQCKQFVYGGCKGNENNFKTEAECRNTCRGTGTFEPNTGTCNQSPDVGTCRGSFPRYYYNPITRNCETFVYGGCGGNSNNFKTYQECMTTCKAS